MIKMKRLFVVLAILLSGVYTQAQVKVGDKIQGGIVFHVNDDGKSGLIAAPEDQTPKKVIWGGNGNTDALSPNNGVKNTNMIIQYFDNKPQKSTNKTTAAHRCASLELNGYDDWYLPAINELRLMYEHRDLIGNFRIGDYCSSTEAGKKDAYSIHFRPHRRVEFYYNKNDRDYFVRCIRKFQVNSEQNIVEVKESTSEQKQQGFE
jgi:hypothetical protein